MYVGTSSTVCNLPTYTVALRVSSASTYFIRYYSSSILHTVLFLAPYVVGIEHTVPVPMQYFSLAQSLTAQY